MLGCDNRRNLEARSKYLVAYSKNLPKGRIEKQQKFVYVSSLFKIDKSKANCQQLQKILMLTNRYSDKYAVKFSHKGKAIQVNKNSPRWYTNN